MRKALNLLCFFTGVTLSSTAQDSIKHVQVHLGSINLSVNRHTSQVSQGPVANCTRAEILANPVLIAENGCEVTDFVFSCAPEEPHPEFVRGSRLTDQMLERIKKLHYLNIFIENIHVKCNGQRM
jgi:hypothetical protein